jgi:hypothetical protein
MYERFTDGARKVMQLANQAAIKFNHPYIGTEHILLGLAEENSGIAAEVLSDFAVDPRAIRRKVERLLPCGSQPMVWGNLPSTPRAKGALRYAMEEACHLNHHHVGTEHLLLGLMREPGGLAAYILMDFGLKLESVRDRLTALSLDANRAVELAQTPDAKTTAADMLSIDANRTVHLAGQEIEDLPEELASSVAELSAEIRRLKLEKEDAVAGQQFERAAQLRDRADELHCRKRALIRDRLVNHPINPAWLSSNDGAVVKLAQQIHQQHSWNELPLLAQALEQAGCADKKILDHCLHPPEHSNNCWVVEVLLAKR